MPGLHIDKFGAESSFNTSNDLAGFPINETNLGGTKFVKETNSFYFYDPEALTGDITPVSRVGRKGFWRKIDTCCGTNQENRNQVLRVYEGYLAEQSITEYLNTLNPKEVRENDNLYIQILSDAEFRPFITKWNITANNEEISIPFNELSGLDCRVDWGDGSPVENFKSDGYAGASHIYQIPGEYNISISGICEKFDLSLSEHKDKITEVVQWGDVAFYVIKFDSCSNLATLPQNEIPNFHNCESCDYIFSNTAVELIPPVLFYNCENTLNMSSAFFNCNLSINGIPEDLFKYCPKIETFSSAFEVTHLTSVPENLFQNNLLAKNFDFTFHGNFLEVLPDKLFITNTLAESFRYTFYSNELIKIPYYFFNKNSKVLNFDSTFSSNQIIEIPEGLFDYTPLVTTFQRVFSDNKLQSIPQNLFKYTTEVTSFKGAFETNFIEQIPFDLFYYTEKVTNFSNVFNHNSLLALPVQLLSKMNLMSECDFAFHDNKLKAVPGDLFAYNPELKNISHVFSQNQIEVIPVNIISRNPLLDNIQSIFSVNEIEVIPVSLFKNLPNVVSVQEIFAENKLKTIPSGLFDSVPDVYDYSLTFSKNPTLTGMAPELWNGDAFIHANCFLECYGLSNYEAIPADWK